MTTFADYITDLIELGTFRFGTTELGTATYSNWNCSRFQLTFEYKGDNYTYGAENSTNSIIRALISYLKEEKIDYTLLDLDADLDSWIIEKGEY